MEEHLITQHYTLPSGSSYQGMWDTARKYMSGLGEYRYPNGTTYNGYFARGRFHGHGRITIPAPYNCSIEGFFLKGILVEIFEIQFEDELWLTPQMKDGVKMDFSSWQYCTPNDRRFVIEHILQISPVGPESRLTAGGFARPLNDYSYDVEEGIFNTKTNLVTHRRAPFTGMRFVHCNERPWIVENCRCGGIPNISPKQYDEIFANNIANDSTIIEYISKCNLKPENIYPQYYPKMCIKSNSSNDDSEKSNLTVDDYDTSIQLEESNFDETRLLVDHQEIMYLTNYQDKGLLDNLL